MSRLCSTADTGPSTSNDSMDSPPKTGVTGRGSVRELSENSSSKYPPACATGDLLSCLSRSWSSVDTSSVSFAHRWPLLLCTLMRAAWLLESRSRLPARRTPGSLVSTKWNAVGVRLRAISRLPGFMPGRGYCKLNCFLDSCAFHVQAYCSLLPSEHY